MPRAGIAFLLSITLFCSGCSVATTRTAGFVVGGVGALGVIGAATGGAECASNATAHCTGVDAAFLLGLGLGGAALAGIGVALATAKSSPPDPAEPKPAAPERATPDPNDVPRPEEDVRFGSEKPPPSE